MPRFFISPDEPTRERMLLDEQESHHASSVLRLTPGQTAELLDGRGRVLTARVEGFERDRLALRVDGERRIPRPTRVEVTLAASVFRQERYDLLIEKATELGVAAIVPVAADRSVVKLSPERWAAKTARWIKIARESCKQCGQPYEPRIEAPRTLDAFLDERAEGDALLIPTLGSARRATAAAALAAARRSGRAALTWLIGPEGDFTERELDAALTKGATAVNLGPLVLRSETAAWYVLSVTNFYFRETEDASASDR